jgi:phage gp16-like protein
MRNSLIAKLHVAKRDLRLDDGTYRAVLVAETGKTSARDMSPAELAAAIEGMKRRGWVDRPKPAGARKMGGKYAGVLRALWIAAWNLGIARDRTDKALTAWVKRQTGIDNPTWLTDPADARKAIEALKAWIAREMGGTWPEKVTFWGENPAKAQVLRWQWQILHPDWSAQVRFHTLRDMIAPEYRQRPLADVPGDKLDALQAELGRRVREMKARSAETEAAHG